MGAAPSLLGPTSSCPRTPSSLGGSPRVSPASRGSPSLRRESPGRGPPEATCPAAADMGNSEPAPSTDPGAGEPVALVPAVAASGRVPNLYSLWGLQTGWHLGRPCLPGCGHRGCGGFMGAWIPRFGELGHETTGPRLPQRAWGTCFLGQRPSPTLCEAVGQLCPWGQDPWGDPMGLWMPRNLGKCAQNIEAQIAVFTAPLPC